MAHYNPYYNPCPDCGANLDPGERCDCRTRKAELRESVALKIKADPKTGQYAFRLDARREH